MTKFQSSTLKEIVIVMSSFLFLVCCFLNSEYEQFMMKYHPKIPHICTV